jgi:hypothetical protein
MIKLNAILKEFMANPQETPEIHYGNETRPSYAEPSLSKTDMNAIVDMNDFVCKECGGVMAPIGECYECNTPAIDNEVFGNPSQDHEAEMAKSEIKDMIKNAVELYNTIQPGTELPAWMSSYITLSSDYIHSVNEFTQGQNK